MLAVCAPIEGPRFLPQPEPQLLAIHLQEVCHGDVLKVGAGAEQLVYGGARPNVDEGASKHFTWVGQRERVPVADLSRWPPSQLLLPQLLLPLPPFFLCVSLSRKSIGSGVELTGSESWLQHLRTYLGKVTSPP